MADRIDTHRVVHSRVQLRVLLLIFMATPMGVLPLLCKHRNTSTTGNGYKSGRERSRRNGGHLSCYRPRNVDGSGVVELYAIGGANHQYATLPVVYSHESHVNRLSVSDTLYGSLFRRERVYRVSILCVDRNPDVLHGAIQGGSGPPRRVGTAERGWTSRPCVENGWVREQEQKQKQEPEASAKAGPLRAEQDAEVEEQKSLPP